MTIQRKIIIGIVVVVVAGVAYYGISPLFHTIKIDEPLPVQEARMEGSAPASIQGTTAHPASGTVRVVEADGQKYLRYENFKTINGPDIYVYLAKDVTATEYIDLGKVRATEGNINYEIPEGTNLSEYPYALVWCKQFGVLFNSAKVSP
jgi:hypothetical protein